MNTNLTGILKSEEIDQRLLFPELERPFPKIISF